MFLKQVRRASDQTLLDGYRWLADKLERKFNTCTTRVFAHHDLPDFMELENRCGSAEDAAVVLADDKQLDHAAAKEKKKEAEKERVEKIKRMKEAKKKKKKAKEDERHEAADKAGWHTKNKAAMDDRRDLRLQRAALLSFFKTEVESSKPTARLSFIADVHQIYVQHCKGTGVDPDDVYIYSTFKTNMLTQLQRSGHPVQVVQVQALSGKVRDAVHIKLRKELPAVIDAEQTKSSIMAKLLPELNSTPAVHLDFRHVFERDLFKRYETLGGDKLCPPKGNGKPQGRGNRVRKFQTLLRREVTRYQCSGVLVENGKTCRGKAVKDILYAGVLAGVPARDAHGKTE